MALAKKLRDSIAVVETGISRVQRDQTLHKEEIRSSRVDQLKNRAHNLTYKAVAVAREAARATCSAKLACSSDWLIISNLDR